MSVQRERDGHTHPPHQPSQEHWGQYPPSTSGSRWTCHVCQSIFGTIEQREKHQQECPGQTPPTRATQWGSRTYPSGHKGGDVYPSHQFQQTSHSSDFSTVARPHAPNAAYQHPTRAPVPAAYQQRPTGVPQHLPLRKSTQLIWLKETHTMDTQVTYIDDVEGAFMMKWNSPSQFFEGAADLSLGIHSGCLTLTTSDVVLPISRFLVEQGGSSPQRILISSGQKRISNPQTGNPGEIQRDRTAREKIGNMDEAVNKLTADLDQRNTELAQQRQENERYKQQIADMSQQIETVSKDNQNLRVAEKQTPEIPVEIEELNSQILDWKKKCDELERDSFKLKKEKMDTNNYLDYLYKQKQQLEDQLQKVSADYQESQSKIQQLTTELEKRDPPPPLPTRSKPAIKEKDRQTADVEVEEAKL